MLLKSMQRLTTNLNQYTNFLHAMVACSLFLPFLLLITNWSLHCYAVFDYACAQQNRHLLRLPVVGGQCHSFVLLLCY